MNEQQFIDNLKSRLRVIFSAYQQGKDVPPVTLFRLEGAIEAASFLGFLTHQQANELIIEAWKECYEAPIPDLSNTEIIIPSVMHRAPVYPTTSA